MDYESECKWINISCGAVIPGVLVILAESLWKIGSFRRSLTSGNFPKWVLTVSFLRGAAWHAAFTRMWKRASGSRARVHAHVASHAYAYAVTTCTLTWSAARNADVREAAWHIFHPFASANLTRSRFPGVGGRRENDFIIHEMQSALGSLEKYRAISRKSKSRYRVLVLNVARLRFTRGYGAPAGAFFGRIYGTRWVCAPRNVRRARLSAAASVWELIDANIGMNK